MIRLVYAVRRKNGLSQQAFTKFALDTYGQLVKEAAPDLGITKHQQLHNLADPIEPTVDQFRGTMLRPFDAVLEFWFESLEEVPKFSGEKSEKLLETEAEFIQHDESSAWISYEVPHINPTPETIVAAPDSSIARLFYALSAPSGMTVEEAQWYWRVQHGPLVRRVGQDIQTLRYVQVHTIEHSFNDEFRSARGLVEPFYGHAELWFDLSKEPAEGAKQAAILLYEDETRFIDFSQSAIFYGKETVLVGA